MKKELKNNIFSETSRLNQNILRRKYRAPQLVSIWIQHQILGVQTKSFGKLHEDIFHTSYNLKFLFLFCQVVIFWALVLLPLFFFANAVDRGLHGVPPEFGQSHQNGGGCLYQHPLTLFKKPYLLLCIIVLLFDFVMYVLMIENWDPFY